MVHTDMTDGWTVTTEIPVQKSLKGYKNYTIGARGRKKMEADRG